MASGIGTIEVKRQRGGLVLQGLGRTPRGTKFIRETEALGVKNMADPEFKTKMAAAVKKMLSETP